jgi:hypothetical protein
VGADELRVGLPLGAEDRTAHQQLHLGPAGRVDGVAMPADRRRMRTGQQEHLLDACHRRDQRALVSEVTGDGFGRDWQAGGRLAGADQRPDPFAATKQLPDQRRADLAACPDDKDQRSLPHDVPSSAFHP